MKTLVSVNAIKNPISTLNRILTYLIIVLLAPLSWSQTKPTPVKKKWEELRKDNGFSQSETYQGPERDLYTDPTTINENKQSSQGSANPNYKPYNGVPLTNRQIRKGRKTPNNPNGPGGSGTIKEDPNIQPSEDWDAPEIEPRKQDNLEINGPGKNFWLYLGLVILAIAAAFVIYQIIKNKQGGSDAIIPFEPLSEDLNPATISKTELELRLEEAISKGDYKECVRIYFLFAMKELIERRWIFWKKEKTNMHYIIEMQGRPGAYEFEKIVNIYDVVWYGDYTIDQSTYTTLEKELEKSYKTIEAQR